MKVHPAINKRSTRLLAFVAVTVSMAIVLYLVLGFPGLEPPAGQMATR